MPHFIHCEKYLNKSSLNDHRVPLIDRTITIEGNGTFASKELVKSTSLIRELEKSSTEIAAHITSILPKDTALNSMKLLFRQDAFDRLQLLLCSSLKVSSEICGNPRRIFDCVKRHVDYDILSPLVFEGDESVVKINTRDFKCKRCPICLKEINGNQLYEVNNLTLVEMHKQHTANSYQEVLPITYYDLTNKKEDSSSIPKAIQNLYPGISYKTYSTRKRDPVWQYEVSRVCSDCWTFIITL